MLILQNLYSKGEVMTAQMAQHSFIGLGQTMMDPTRLAD